MDNKFIIYRDKYFSLVEPFIGKKLIKILIGQRRVGKSFVMYQLIEQISKLHPNALTIYINKEDYQFDSIRNYSDLIEYVEEKKAGQKKVHLFIDEIQEIEGFERALRHFQTQDDYDIYCTGSNASLLSGEIATMLAGRYIQIRIHSLTYTEFLTFHKLKQGKDSLMKYMSIGGMPYLINLKDEESVRYEYLKNIFDSIVLRDIVARYKIRNTGFLRDLILFLADNTGSIVSAKKISDYLKSQKIAIAPKQIVEYMSYLENVFYIDRVKRAAVVGKKIFEIGDKFYFEDIGLRNCLIPFNLKDISKIIENVIYHHLVACRYDVYVGKMNSHEIDFIAEKKGERIYIQAAYIIADEKTHEREFGNLLKIDDNFKKIVVSIDEPLTATYKGIEHWSLIRFLTEFE